MFRRFPYVTLVCWIHAAVMMYVITGENSLGVKQMLVISRSDLKESEAGLVSFVGLTPMTLTKFAVQ